MTEKEYAVEFVNRMIPVTEQIESYYASIIQLQQSNEVISADIEKGKGKKKNWILLPIYLIGAVTALLYYTAGHHPLLAYLYLMLGCAGGACIYYIALKEKLAAIAPDPELESMIEENNAQIEEINNEATEYYQMYEKMLNAFPSDYQYTQALYFFRKALANGRADSLKEVINLYEDTLFKQNMADEMRRQHQEELDYLRAIENASNRAADNAASAAFWSAMNHSSRAS